MGYIFRINKTKGATKTSIEDWSNTTNTTYNNGYVDKIPDATTTQREITSIPSPFARIELVKEAFGKVISGTLSSMSIDEVKEMLHGNSIYHKMVSDSLDIGQIFFSYEAMKDKIEILVWEKDKCLDDLQNSSEQSHQLYGKTLAMFFDQDAKGSDPYNFGKMQNLYILRYKGTGRRPMHIIGATSPATLFFSTANDEHSISKELCFGTDYAFDTDYASLDERATDYIKYLFSFRYSEPQFNTLYPEVAKYLDAVYYVLDDGLKNEIDDIESACSQHIKDSVAYVDTCYEKLSIQANATTICQVEVNGRPIHYKRYVPDGQEEFSDFLIKTTKQIEGQIPLVLPITNSITYKDYNYFGSAFGINQKIPYYDNNDLELRKLPGIGIKYPYLTISDFLYDKIIQLPSEINTTDYFDGNFTSNHNTHEGYLLPVKPLFFYYFKSETLLNTSPSGKNTLEIKTVASGVEVILRIPIKGGEVEYKRNYTLDVKADQANNYGAIVLAPEDFIVGVFPSVKFKNTEDAHYRIAILSDFKLNKECSCELFDDEESLFVPEYVSRNVDIEDDIRAKVYCLEKKAFDCAFISILTDQSGKEKQATGLMFPKFRQRTGTSNLTFAIDLGTSNTHIEYTSGANTMPTPFTYGKEWPMFSMICKPSDTLRKHTSGEILPEAIGKESQCHFPTRTVLSIDRNNSGINDSGVGSYIALGNASPAFMYNKFDVGAKYNNYIPNLKWSQQSEVNEERIRCYIESLFLMIRTKVIQEGGSLAQTQIKWFYPISMSNHKKGLFQKVWTAAYQKYFNPESEPIAITESIAPYSFFQQTNGNVTNIVTIDIGGGTTDIVVATSNVDDTNEVKLISSMRFAADVIFGNSLVQVQNGPLNGIIKLFKDEFISNLEGLDDLQKMLKNKTENNMGNSSEVASFLFSLEENDLVMQKNLQNKLSFNNRLTKENNLKIIFYIFYTSIIYHIAHLMRAKGLPAPTNIAFSGNGSKVISILSPVKESLELLTSKIFSLVYGIDINVDLLINLVNPKEATCKGGLFLKQVPNNVAEVKSVLLSTDKGILVESQTYNQIPSYYDDVVKDVKSFMNFITLRLPKIVSLNSEFGINQKSLDLAVECFNKDLKPYIERGVKLKHLSGDVGNNDVIEEPLFFYPIIGVINELSELIYKSKK